MKTLILIVILSIFAFYAFEIHPTNVYIEQANQKCQDNLVVSVSDAIGAVDDRELCDCISAKVVKTVDLDDKIRFAYDQIDFDQITESDNLSTSSKECLTTLYPHFDIKS